MKLVIPGWLPGLNEYIDAERAHRQKGAALKRQAEQGVILAAKVQLRRFRPTRPVVMEAIEPCFSALGFAVAPQSVGEVRAQYKRMAKAMHPDGGGTTAAFEMLNENYKRCLELMERETT